VAILPTAAARARAWGDAFLNLAFPFPESEEAAPKRIEPPFCSRCGYPYEHVPDSPFVCATCAENDWHFAWARAGYLTEGQVRESIVGFKYEEQFYRLAPLLDWLGEAFDRHASAESWDALIPVPLYHRRPGPA
jgi:predicted amidophosphoribosyltransferase